MSMNEVIEQVNDALGKLGVKERDVQIEPNGINRYKVIVGGEYFGMWDTVRQTFVD